MLYQGKKFPILAYSLLLFFVSQTKLRATSLKRFNQTQEGKRCRLGTKETLVIKDSEKDGKAIAFYKNIRGYWIKIIKEKTIQQIRSSDGRTKRVQTE